MKELRQLVLKQLKAGQISKDEAADMLAFILNKNHAIETADIAVIGMACRFPPNNDLAGFWQDLKDGVDMIGHLSETRRQDIAPLTNLLKIPEPSYHQAAFLDQIDRFDYTLFKISPGEAQLIDPQQRFALEVALECIENAGYSRANLNGSRTGVYMGYSESEYEWLIPADEPSAVHATLPAMIAGRIAYLFNFSGPSQVVETTCSSSLVAVHHACQGIVNGDCDLALAGGVRLMVFPFAEGYDSDQQIGISSPDGRTRAFDETASGTGSGEGVGIILLKPLAKAIKDRDHIYAVIKGSAVNSDGRSNGITAPNPDAQAKVIVQAWKRAKIDPETITYIEAHGTATKLGDPIEVQGLTTAFRRFTAKENFCAVGSVKTNLGHLSSAAGIAGLIKTILALKYHQIPPSLHFKRPNPLIDFNHSPLFVNDKLTVWDSSSGPRRAGVSSFGISGTNCHLLLEEYIMPNLQTADEAAEELVAVFTLSAASQQSLYQLVKKYSDFLATTALHNYRFEDIVYTANTGRDLHAHRLAVLASSVADLHAKLVLIESAFSSGEINETLINGVYMGFVQDVGEDLDASSFVNGDLAPAELANLFVSEPHFQWEPHFTGQVRSKVPLPTYAFENKRCWIPFEKNRLSARTQLKIDLNATVSGENGRDQGNDLVEKSKRKRKKTDWLYTLSWQEKQHQSTDLDAKVMKGTWLLLMDELGVGDVLAAKLTQSGCKPILVYPGAKLKREGDQCYQIAPTSQKDWQQLLQTLSQQDLTPLAGIIHLWTFTVSDKNEQNAEDFIFRQEKGFLSLFALMKSLIAFQSKQFLEVWIVSNDVTEVVAEDITISPEKAPLWGLSKVIPQEFYWAKCYCVDIVTTDQLPGQMVDQLLAEMSQKVKIREQVVAYRHNRRFIQQIERLKLDQVEDEERPLVKDGGVYLIAGGAGHIGLGIGKYLASQASIKLILINRSKLPPRSEWQTVMATGHPEDKTFTRLVGIKEIEDLGSEVIYYSADIGDAQVMDQIIKDIHRQHGQLDGVINATMEVRRKKLIELNQPEFEDSVKNRIRGAVVLDQVTRTEKLAFFIILSSISSIFGGVSEADDVCSNIFLDVYGAWMHRKRQNVRVLNLPGIQRHRVTPATVSEQVLLPISAEDLAELFEAFMKKKVKFAFIEDFNFDQIHALLPMLPVRFAKSILTESITHTSFVAEKEVVESIQYKLSGEGKDDRTALECKIAEVWVNVLGYKEISSHDNFFDLGGDSLMAIRLLRSIRHFVKVELTISEIFEYPTIASLADWIESQSKEAGFLEADLFHENADDLQLTESSIDYADADLLIPIPRDQDLITSSAQQHLWYLEQLDPGNPVNNISVSLEVTGPLAIDIFIRCINEIVTRHEILRTTLTMVEDKIVQIIAPRLTLEPEKFDLSALPASEYERKVLEISQEQSRFPFDLVQGPLFRCSVIYGSHNHVIILTAHHIIFDGWSMGVFFQELATLYQAFSNGKPSPLPPLPIQYVDFAYWQNQRLKGPVYEKLKDYWRKQLSDMPQLDLLTDYPRPETMDFQGQNYHLALPLSLSNELKALSRQEDVSPFVILLAAFSSLLRLYSGDDDIVIGAFSAHRHRVEIRNLIGLFVNTLILRIEHSGHPTFRQLMRRVSQVVLEASEHQDLTFEQILDVIQPTRTFQRLPLVQVAFDFFVDPLQNVVFQDLVFKSVSVDRKISRFDLTLEITDQGENGMYALFEYNSKLFKPETIIQMAKRFEVFLQNIVANPDTPI